MFNVSIIFALSVRDPNKATCISGSEIYTQGQNSYLVSSRIMPNNNDPVMKQVLEELATKV